MTVSEVYKSFSKGKPINQINVIESHKIMVSLSGNYPSSLHYCIIREEKEGREKKGHIAKDLIYCIYYLQMGQ